MVLQINHLFTEIIESVGKNISGEKICFEKFSEVVLDLEKYMSKGMLVPDDIVIEILEERLSRPTAQNGVVLDGFSRTKAQAKYLKSMLAKKGKKVDVAIRLNIPDEDLIYRTVKRRICSNFKYFH